MNPASITSDSKLSDPKILQSLQIFENIAEFNRQMSSTLAYLLTSHLQHNTNRSSVANTKPQTKQAAVPPRPPLNSRFTYSHTGDDAPQYTETGYTQFAKADNAPAESPAYTAKVSSPTSVLLRSVTAAPSFEPPSPYTKKPPSPFTSEQFAVDSARLEPTSQTPVHAVNTPSKNTTDDCSPYSDSDRSPPPSALESIQEQETRIRRLLICDLLPALNHALPPASPSKASTSDDADLPDLESSSSSEGKAAELPEQLRGKFWDSDTESSVTPSLKLQQDTLPGYWSNPLATYDTPSQQYELLAAAEDLHATAPPVKPESSRKDDNPSASADDTSANTFRFRAPPKRRKTKPRSRELQQQPRLSEGIDNLYLEEATCRNELFCQCSEFFQATVAGHLEFTENQSRSQIHHEEKRILGHLDDRATLLWEETYHRIQIKAQSTSEAAFVPSLLCLQETLHRQAIQSEAFDTYVLSFWLIESETMAREAHNQLWSKLGTRLQSELWLCDRQDVQDKMSAAFDSVTIMTLEGFEDELRSFLHCEDLQAWRKKFGASHLSCCQRVMGYQIKCHQKDTIFSNSWKKTVALNGGHLPQD